MMTGGRIRVLLVLVTLATASCATGVVPKVVTRKAAPSAAPTGAHVTTPVVLSASVAPTAVPASTVPAGGLDTLRRTQLVDALRNAVAASRASRLTATLSSVSGVLSNNAAGIIANNAGNILSDSGGNLVDSSGNGVVSDHGGGLVSKTKYTLADVAASDATAATPAASPTATVADGGTSPAASASPDNAAIAQAAAEDFQKETFTSETANLVYVVDVETPKTGGFKSYDKQAYHGLPADQLATALVDDFSWDDVVPQPSYKGDPMQLGMEYHLKKNFSKRVPFADRLISRQLLRIVPSTAGFNTQPIGWEIEFALDVALVGGDRDHASFKAVAGEKDIVEVPASDSGTLSLPQHLAITGQNDRGTYVGSLDGHDTIHFDVTHTTPAGATTHLVIDTALDGSGRENIAVPTAKLAVSLDLDGKGGGKGRLDDTSGSTPIKVGDVTWDADGVATIAFPDGTSLKASLF